MKTLLRTKNVLFIFWFLFTLGQTNAQERSDMEVSGDIIMMAMPAISFGTTFIYKDNTKSQWQFVKAYALANLVTNGLKPLVNETRPNGEDYSFPSGHSASAFTGAAFLQLRYGWKVGIPAYMLAAYVGYTRVEADKHYVWDVASGAAIGIGSALLFVKPYHNKNIDIQVFKQDRFYKFGLAYKF